MPPDIGHRQRDVLGERSGTIHAHAPCVRAQVPPSREAVAAASAHHVPFAADDFARMKIVDVRSDRDNLADELVPDRHRNGNRVARPLVPFVNVHVGAANSGVGDSNQDVVDADRRFGYIFEPQSGRRPAFYEGFQRLFRFSHIAIILLHGRPARVGKQHEPELQSRVSPSSRTTAGLSESPQRSNDYADSTRANHLLRNSVPR